MCGNKELNTAGKSKNDDFYTTYEDIEVELSFYRESFANKTVFCNCDDPLESNFVRFFLDKFNEYHLKRLVATSYSESEIGSARPISAKTLPRNYRQGAAHYISVTDVPTEFESSDDYETLFNMRGNELRELDGNGDFRSNECSCIIDQADILVTNPPFSLFRDYIKLVDTKKKDFLIIGNMNALTYKEVFPLFQEGRLWLGRSIHSGDRKFYVPDSYPLEAAGCGIDDDGRRYIRVKGVRWFTNMKGDSEFKHLPLVKTYRPQEYPKLENYDAINVCRTKDIPRDFTGVMGVPISFLDRYCPDQFEILMLANGNARTNTDPETLELVGYTRLPNDKGGVGILDGRRLYARVLIRNRCPEKVKA